MSVNSSSAEIKINDTISIDLDKNAFKIVRNGTHTYMQMSIVTIKSETGNEISRKNVDLKSLEREELQNLATRVDTLFKAVYENAGDKDIKSVCVDNTNVKVKNASSDNWTPLESPSLSTAATAISDYIKTSLPKLLPTNSKDDTEPHTTFSELASPGLEKEKTKKRNTPIPDFNSASVLPYFFNEEVNEGFYLVGEEEGFWSDFGGNRDPGETNTRTAAREVEEETIGLLPEIQSNILSKRDTYEVFRKDQGKHFQNITRISQEPEKIKSIREKFRSALEQPTLKSTQREKKQLAWIRASDLTRELSAPGKFTTVPLYTQPDPNAPVLIKNPKLRPALVGNLVIINNIAKREGLTNFIGSGMQEKYGQETILDKGSNGKVRAI